MASKEIEYKAEFFTGIAGIIFGMISAGNMIITYLFFRENGDSIFQDNFLQLSSGFDPTQLTTFLSALVGVILGILMILYIQKVSKDPTQRDFIILTIFGAVSIFTPFGFGGLLVLVAGIIGIARVKK